MVTDSSCRPIQSVMILVIKQIGLPLLGRPILLITRMITDRIGLLSVLLPLHIICSKCMRNAAIAVCIQYVKHIYRSWGQERAFCQNPFRVSDIELVGISVTRQLVCRAKGQSKFSFKQYNLDPYYKVAIVKFFFSVFRFLVEESFVLDSRRLKVTSD